MDKWIAKKWRQTREQVQANAAKDTDGDANRKVEANKTQIPTYSLTIYALTLVQLLLTSILLTIISYVRSFWSIPFLTFIRFPGHKFDFSEIMGNNTEYKELLKGWLAPVVGAPSKWKLCYRATLHGWSSGTFHSQCNSHGPSISFVRVKDYIFGGYTDVDWRKWTCRRAHSKQTFNPDASFVCLGISQLKSM